jgi:hypothetical protein
VCFFGEVHVASVNKASLVRITALAVVVGKKYKNLNKIPSGNLLDWIV